MQVATTKDQGLYNKPSAGVHPGALAAGTLPQYNTIRPHLCCLFPLLISNKTAPIQTNLITATGLIFYKHPLGSSLHILGIQTDGERDFYSRHVKFCSNVK